jgi:peptidoglycan/xylan/chitin deacetylase (PgdA/CDA1 family)
MRVSFVAVLLVVGLALGAVGGLNAQTLPAGLVAAYGFNEGSGSTTADASGNSNTGTISGATWTTSGRYGNALSFNGSSNRVNINDANSLDLTTGMTLEAWTYPTSLSGWRTVILKEISGGQAYALYAYDNASRPAVYINLGGNYFSVAGTTGIPLNTWTHLAATYDGTTLKLFVNGSQVGSKAISGAIRVSTSPLRIGGNAVWGRYFRGRIDEVRVYNRALSQAEIQSDMSSAISSDTTPPTAPSNLTATAVSASQINLSWTASTDNVGVTRYQVERCRGTGCSNFATLTTVTGTTYNNTGLSAGTSYSYQVRATDAAGNLSTYSNTASATTKDTTPPTAPSNLAATAVSASQINLSWTASTDNVGVTGYQVERCRGTGCSNFATLTTVTETTYNNTGLSFGTSYSYRVRATDAAGNFSSYSNTASASTLATHAITYWPDKKSGAVSLTFDDDCDSQTSLGVPALNARGLKGTFFLVTDWVASWDPWKNAATMGHEIGGHTKTHPYLTTLTLPEVQDELAESKAVIDAQITPQKCLTFAYPFGDLNSSVESIVQNTYTAARGIICGLNSEPFDFYNVRACSPDDGDDMYAQADAAEQQGKWLVSFMHSLDGGTDCWGSLQISYLTDYLDYLATKNLWVGAFGAMVKYIRERESATLSLVSASDSQIVLNLTDSLDDLIYDEALTVRSEVPSDWVNVNVWQGSSITTVASVLEGATRTIYYHAVPDRGVISLEGTTTPPDTTPPTVTAFTIPATATSVTVPITSFTATDNVGVTGYLVNESATAPSATTGGWLATAPTSYTFTTAGSKILYAWAKDAAGNVSASRSDSVTITLSGPTTYSIWSNSAKPVVAADPEVGAGEVGVKFRSDVNGYITGIRFYKASTNTGTHIGSLWTDTGTLLATATFTNETASGWQQVTFSTPVVITANTVYVASYHMNVGHYSDDPDYFAGKGVDNPPLHALADGVSGENGVGAAGSTSTFPNQGWRSSNYWVDVVFQTQL